MISCINLLRKDPAIDQDAFRAFLEGDYAQLFACAFPACMSTSRTT